jgi:uncharacterized protein (TIGR02145 family)
MIKHYLSIFYLFFTLTSVNAEGTKELRPLETHKGELCIDTTRNKFCSVIATEEYRLHIHISDFANEAIYFGFGETKHNDGATNFRFYRPDGSLDTSGAVPTATGTRGYIDSWAQAVAGPTVVAAGGYWALRCTPDANGDYYLAFKITWSTGPFTDTYKTWANFDVTVVNTTTMQAIPGRVWSKAWQLYSETPTAGSTNQFWGKMFVYSVDSIITKCDFNGMIPGTFTVSCNHSGCYPSPPTAAATARKSVSGEHTFPEYKIFLNNPDILAYPSGTLGGLDNTVPITAERNCDGTVNFTFGCTKAGNVELKLLLSTLGPTYVDRIIPQAVNIGLNTVFWDGNDGSVPPKPIPNGSVFNFKISYVNGLTHLPLFDVEYNANGFYLDLIRPTTVPPPPSPLFYWDDTNFSGGSSNFTGCLPNPPTSGCHQWSGTGGGFGNNRTINTWWYAVSTDSDPVQITEKRFPSNLGTISGMTQLCQGNSYTFSVAIDPNSTEYIWTYPGGTNTTTNPSIVVIIPGSATPGPGVVTVQGSNANCGPGPLSTLNVTINGFPNISVSGDQLVCDGETGVTYTTESGQNNYLWSYSSGATLVAGGGINSSFITVNWNGVGAQSISVNYTNPVSGCTAATPFILPVTVNARPVPVISGENSVCALSTNVVYQTETGKSTYLWVVSSGGVITGGGADTDPTVTVTWTTPGARSVSVVYTDPLTGCTAASPTVFNVTVKPLPVPGVSGPSTVCKGSTGNTYTTEPGKLNYSWVVSGGGTISGGGTGTDASVTVTWTTAGAQTVSVNYQDANTLCTGETATIYNVTVNPLPVPALTGPGSVCVNNPGPVYSTTSGETGYTWNIVPPSAGVITSGSGTSSVDVTWTNTGTHAITVNYTDAITGCTAAQPTSYPVTVNTLPVPSLGGETEPCTGLDKQYTTQTGAASYSWNVSAGGTITAGGGPSDPTITINWTTPGAQTVSVNYTIGTGCSGAIPTIYNVNVHQSTPPEITGQNIVCETNTVTYSTQPGNSDYNWSISPGGIFLSGTAGYSVTVQWNNAGARFVEVNFTNNFGCTAPVPTHYSVTVNPLPNTAITAGTNPTCSNAYQTYQVLFDPSCSYTWTISPTTQGLVTTGQGTNSVEINWLTSGNATLQVLGTNNNTGCFSSSFIPVLINPSPEPVFAPCFDLKTTSQSKRFNLRGGSPWVPGSGIFNGNRVSFNNSTGYFEFDPFGAGPGSYQVTYTYTNAFQCSVTTPAVTINVVNSSFSCGGDLTDVRDGKKYRTAMIGTKCWMQDNLSYGNVLSPGTQPQTDNCVPEKYCLSTDATCSNYGGLYQWDELMAYNSTSQNQGLCPPEWHVPSESEWQMLINTISSGVTPPADGIAGSFLKDAYLNPGFRALPGGIYYLNNAWSFTNGLLTGTFYWTSTPNGTDRATARGVNSVNPSASKYPGSKGNAFSVRCVRD